MTDIDRGIQLYDDLGCDIGMARFVSYDRPAFRAAQFVIIDCPSGRRFFGSVSGPNRNYNRDALQPHSSAAINQLESVQDGKMDRAVVVSEFYVYDVHLVRDISGDSASSVRVRPQIASRLRPANEDEIMRYMNLPPVHPETQIGMLIDTDIPLCVSRHTNNHHMLIAGATGGGKSNTIAGVITSALNLDTFVLVLDHKPDYQNVHEPNDEARAEAYCRGIDDVQYWRVGKERAGQKETRIHVQACDLDPAMLAATICYQKSEANQMEELEGIIENFAALQNGERYGIKELRDHIAALRPGSNESGINVKTLDAIKNKVRRSARVPTWITPERTQALGMMMGYQAQPERFDVSTIIKPGRAAVIRIGGGAENGREYGLLLSYILDQIDNYVAKGKSPPIMIVIDEAQDIFCAEDSFKRVAEAMLDRHIRKGRSKRIGYTIGVQSADAVPESIMNNLNSRIIHRHNGSHMVKTALTMATEEQRHMTNTFGPGEALVQMVGSIGIVHARMRMSPFKLTKEDVDA